MNVNGICTYHENHGEVTEGKDPKPVPERNSPFLVTSVTEKTVKTPKGDVTVLLASGYIFASDGSGTDYVEDVPPAGGLGHEDGQPGYTG